MKNLCKKSIMKIAIAVILCACLSMVVSNFAPHISNDVAMGQLENDDTSWSIMQTWNQALQGVELVQAGICIVCIYSVGKDTIKYFKNRKENENEEY